MHSESEDSSMLSPPISPMTDISCDDAARTSSDEAPSLSPSQARRTTTSPLLRHSAAVSDVACTPASSACMHRSSAPAGACSSDDSDEDGTSSGGGAQRPRTSSFSSHFTARGARILPAPASPPPAHAVRSTRPRVLVTGGAGFIGSHVARALLARGEDVAIVDELNDFYSPALKVANLRGLLAEFGPRRVHIHVADICDEAVMESCFATEGCDRVVHLAARAGVRPSSEHPLLYQRTNVQGTTTLLQLAVRHKIKHFVYASSSSVYGDDTPAPFSEEHACNEPVSVYAATKKSCEMLAASYAHLHALPCSGLRFFTCYGPGGRRDMAPFLFTDRMARGLALDMFGEGGSQRDYTFVSDIVAGVLAVLDHPPGHTLQPSSPPERKHEVYNLGCGHPVVLRDFIALIARELGVTPRIKMCPKQPGDVERTYADVSKARRMVGYAPKVSVEEGVRRTVAWYRQQQQLEAQHSEIDVAPGADPSAARADAHSNAAADSPAMAATSSSVCKPLVCLCATRIHNTGSTRVGLSADMLAHLLSWLPRALACAQYVAIAVDTTNQKRDIASAVEAVVASLSPPERARVSVVCVAPWGAFCPALNALLAHAQALACETILYSSLEMVMHPAHIHALAAHLDENTLVVGARLSGHRFVRGQAVIDGCSTVWNTLALWSCAKLARTGFLPVSDGVPAKIQREVSSSSPVEHVLGPAVAGGVEEVACVSMQQILYPHSSQAKLLSMSCATTEEVRAVTSTGEFSAHAPEASFAAAAALASSTSSATSETNDEEDDSPPPAAAPLPQALPSAQDSSTAAASALPSASTPSTRSKRLTLRSNSGAGASPCKHSYSSVTAPLSSLKSKHSSSPLSSPAVAPAAPRIPSLFWDADFSGDAQRQAAHDKKMRSKVERAAQQLAHLHIAPGTVQHIHCTLST